MRASYLLFLLLFLPFFSIAQNNYKPGYVVSLKGDTTRGFVDYKEWERNPKEMHFKSNLSNVSFVAYNIRNAGAFAITGIEYYQRFILPISTDSVDVNKLATKLDTASYIDTVFLRVSTSGNKVTMYRYSDVIKTRFYFMEKGESQPRELIYHAWYDPSESTTVSYSRRFRGQLANLAQKYKVNSSALDAQILETSYIEPEIVRIVQKINGPSAQSFTPQSVGGSRFFAGLAVNYSSLKFTEVGGTSFQNGVVTNVGSVFPKVGGGVDFFLNKNTQSLIIRLELSETGNQYKLDINNGGTPQSTSTLNFSQYTTALTPQLIFNLVNNEAMKLFIGVGAGLNFSAYNKYQYVTKYSGSFADMVQDNYPAFSGFWFSVPIKAGIVVNKKIEINVSYSPSSSITSDNVAVTGNVTSYQLGVNYFFGQ